MRSTHPIFAAALMLMAGAVRPNRKSDTRQNGNFYMPEFSKSSGIVWTKSKHTARMKGWGGPGRYVRLNIPHPPTTAELSKARSMERKWRRAAAMYPGSSAAIALSSPA